MCGKAAVPPPRYEHERGGVHDTKIHYTSMASRERDDKGSQKGTKRKSNGSQRGARRERKGAKGIPNVSQMEAKGQREAAGAKWEPKECQNEARGAKRMLNRVRSY